MTKDVQMSIKMELELHKQFMQAAAHVHRPAAQLVRELMRFYIIHQHLPNPETQTAMRAIEQGDMTTHASTAALYKTLNI